MVRSIVRAVSRSIVRRILRNIKQVLINLESTASAYYKLATPWVAPTSFSIKGKFVWDGIGTQILIGSSIDSDSYIAITSAGAFRGKISGVIIDSAFIVEAGVLESFEVVRVGTSTVTLFLNGTQVASGTSSGDVFLDNIGRYFSNLHFNGIITEVELNDTATPSNSLEFKLNELTKMYELPVNNVFGSEVWVNPPTRISGSWVDNSDGSYTKTSAIAGDVGMYFLTGEILPDTTYVISFTLTNSGDTLNIYTRESGVNTLIVNGLVDGVYSLPVKSGDGGGLWFARTPYTGTISNITVKQVTNFLTYEQIATTQDVRDTYTLVDGAWLGSELVVNGGFTTDTDWVKGAGWTIANNAANCDGSQVGSSVLNTSSNLPFGTGNIFKLSVEVSGIAAGQINYVTLVGNGGSDITNITSDGTYQADSFGPSVGDNRIDVQASGTFVGSVDNISIKRLIEVSPQITPVTQGMTLTEAWVTRGTGYTALANANDASVRVDATISNTDSGILMESGGAGDGLVLYVFAGVLYFQCGNGSAFGTTGDRAETSYVLPVGEADYIIEWSADSSSKAVLYVDGVLVDSETLSNSNLGGADAGTVGRVISQVAVNRGGWVAGGSGDYTNTITKCDIFNNQVTPDV